LSRACHGKPIIGVVHQTEENLAQMSTAAAAAAALVFTASRVVNRPSSPGQLLRERNSLSLSFPPCACPEPILVKMITFLV